MSLGRLLSPHSIVVVGGNECERVVEECDRLGFAGRIGAVHPKRKTLAGRVCVGRVADLDFVPDAAFVAVPNRVAVDVVHELAAVGCGGAVVYSAEFAEAGHVELQAALVEAAGDMPLVGPNCYGLLDAGTGAALWPDVHGLSRLASGQAGVALVTQSSNVAINLTMQRRGVPIRRVLTAGNAAATGIADLATAALVDPDVAVIAMHLESVGNPDAFACFAHAAHEVGKPIVVLKAGRSDAAISAARTHTASLAGGAAAHEAFFRRLGVASVRSLDALLEAAKLLLACGAPKGRNILSLSCSGGEAALMADAGAAHGLRFPPLGEAVPALAGALGPRVALANPLDYHTFVWGDRRAMTTLFEAAATVEADLTILVLDWPRDAPAADLEGWDVALECFCEAFDGRPTAVLATLPENGDEAAARSLLAAGIAPLAGIDAALEAVSATAGLVGPGSYRSLAPLRSGQDHVWDENRSKRALAAAGLCVPKGAVMRRSAAVSSLAFPLVAKGLGHAHKTEAGAVRLGLQTEAELEAAVADLLRSSEEVLVEEMTTRPGVELLVGVSRDEVLGPVLTLGAGGVFAELLADTATLLLPVSEGEVRQALTTLRVRSLLDGWRGADAVDVDALVANVLCIARFAVENADTLVELDVNPIIATVYGAVAVDALLVSKTAPPG